MIVAQSRRGWDVRLRFGVYTGWAAVIWMVVFGLSAWPGALLAAIMSVLLLYWRFLSRLRSAAAARAAQTPPAHPFK